MDIDEDRMQASLANDRLEKPFDVKTLRKLVESYVPRTREQKLSGYLSFPKLPEFEEPKKPYDPDNLEEGSAHNEAGSAPPIPGAASQSATGEDKDWNMENFDPPAVPSSDEFEAVDLKASESETGDEPSIESLSEDRDRDLIADSKEDDQMWEEKDIQKYKMNAPSKAHGKDGEPIEDSDPSIDYFVSDEDVDTSSIMDESRAGSMEEDVEFDLEAINNSVEASLPKNIEGDEDEIEKMNKQREIDQTPAGHQRGQTVVLNFDFDAGTNTNSQVVGPDGTTLKQLTAELNEASIQQVIEEQAKVIIEGLVAKTLPD
ncbi:MAG: hypothetical protein AAF202_13825, partial [Pseudomonadota bacterium]